MNFSYGKNFFSRGFSKSFMNNKTCFNMMNSFANGNKFRINFSNKYYFNKMVVLCQTDGLTTCSTVQGVDMMSSTSGSEIMSVEESISSSMFILSIIK